VTVEVAVLEGVFVWVGMAEAVGVEVPVLEGVLVGVVVAV
jgi:hypothetical protein